MAKPRMDLSAFVGKLLEEQDGEWAVADRRYFSVGRCDN